MELPSSTNTWDSVEFPCEAQTKLRVFPETLQVPRYFQPWPDELIRFVGYQRRGPAVGKVGDHDDPFVVIEQARAARSR